MANLFDSETPYVINQNLGLGGQNPPTAKIHIGASNGNSNSSPLKFTSGTLLNNPENGAMEYDGSNLYLTSNSIRNIISSPSGTINVKSYGATGNGQRLFAVVASTSSQTVTCSNANFTQNDIGKIAIVYQDFSAGTITTIQQVISSTQIILTANAGITTTTSNGYMIYGNDDSVAIQAALTAASEYVSTANVTNANEPIGSGHVDVLLPGGQPNSLYLIANPITIPSGVIFNGVGTIANVLLSRNTPCVIINNYVTINRIEIEALLGTGVTCQNYTNAGHQAQISIKEIRVWHGQGSASAPSGLSATASQTGGSLTANTRYYVVTAIDAQGGETLVSNEVSAVTNSGVTTGSNALSWTAFPGAVSYRIYSGFGSGIESFFFTSTTNSYTDTGASHTSFPPIAPGFALQLWGDEFELGKVFIKDCTLGIYHSSGTDTMVDNAFIIGCATSVRINGGGQIHYNNILLDSPGASSGTYYGVMLDNSSNVSMRIQAFQNSAASNILAAVVAIGSYSTTGNNIDIDIDIQANNTGGAGVFLKYAEDAYIKMLLSNTVFSGNQNITTAVEYNGNLQGVIKIDGEYSSNITPSSGTQYGTHNYSSGNVMFTGETTGIFNPKNYGAKGDGSTDDTTALQSCLTAIINNNGGTMIWCASTYIASALTYVSNAPLTILGSGATLQGNTGGNTLFLINTGNAFTNGGINIIGLRVNGNNVNSNSVGIEIRDSLLVQTENVLVENFGNSGSIGILLHNYSSGGFNEEHTFINTYVHACTNGWLTKIESGAAPSLNECHWISSGASDCTFGWMPDVNADYRRTHMTNTTWWAEYNNQTCMVINGNMTNTDWDCAFEWGFGTGATAVSVASNLPNQPVQYKLNFTFIGWGSIGGLTQFVNNSSYNVVFDSGADIKGLPNFAPSESNMLPNQIAWYQNGTTELSALICLSNGTFKTFTGSIS
jgi:hypothetical protein